MPYAYSPESAPVVEEIWDGPSSASQRARGRLFVSMVVTAAAAVVGTAAYGIVLLAGSNPPFNAASLASNYPASSFEAVRLTSGDLFFAHITAHDGMVELADPYFVDPTSGRLVQGKPGFAPLSGQAGMSAGRFGAGRPLVVNPTQILTVEPVDPTSTIGRSIAAIEGREARQRAATSTTKAPFGFQ